MWNPLGLKLCGAVVRQGEREGVEERDNIMAQQELVNRLQTLSIVTYLSRKPEQKLTRPSIFAGFLNDILKENTEEEGNS